MGPLAVERSWCSELGAAPSTQHWGTPNPTPTSCTLRQGGHSAQVLGGMEWGGMGQAGMGPALLQHSTGPAAQGN